MTQAVRIARATAADIPFIMATERREGYDANVGRWEESRHAEAMRDGRHAYFIGEAGGPIGFVIARDWSSVERATQIKRIAVVAPGQGYGRKLLGAVVNEAFRITDVHRMWLGVYPDNTRARRSYAALGFVPEGIARASAYFDGAFRDELVMSLLRPDWRG